MLRNNKGNSLIGALVVMVVLGGAAASVVSTSGVDTRSYTNDMQSQQALAVGNAGLQWALDRVNNGYDPSVENKIFGAGYFNVDSTPDSSLITVTAFVGDAKRVQSINADYARNCFDVEGYEVTVSGNTVSGIELEKDCNEVGLVASVTVDWNASACAIGVDCEVDEEDVEEVSDDDSEDCNEQDDNNGHGNDCDHDDDDNPGQGGGNNGADDDSDSSLNLQSFAVKNAYAKNWNWNNNNSDDDSDNNSNDNDSDDTATDTGTATATDDDSGDGNDNQDDDHSDNANEDDSDDHDNGNGNDDDSEDDDSGDDDSEDEEVVVSCMAEADAAVELAVCAADSDGLTLTGITLAGASIFDAGVVPEGSAAAANGETVDISDAAVDEDGSHLMAFEFSGDVTPGTWFTVTIQFVDGSSATSTFKAGTEAGVEPVEEGEAEADQVDQAASGFSVDNGSVVVDAQYQVDVQMLGSAITCGAGGSEIDVTADLCIDGTCSDLFNGADIDGGELYSVVNNTDDADYTIRATASSANCGNFSQTYESTDTVQVRTLLNGEAAPALEGFGGQQSVQDFLDAYVDDAGNVVLAANQVIMLFEMGTDVSDDPDSSAADFQDLVVLMTITEL